jgi:hypothetical protein
MKNDRISSMLNRAEAFFGKAIMGSGEKHSIRMHRLMDLFSEPKASEYFKQLDAWMEEAEKEKDQSAAWSYRAVRALLIDEMVRNEYLDHLAKRITVDPETFKTDVANALVAYDMVLDHVDVLPQAITRHLTMRDLQGRYSDLLANEVFYTGAAPKPEELLMARQMLWRISFLEMREGKRVEQALVGLLRYGPRYYQLSREGKARVGSERAARLALDLLQPALHVEHSLPREDLYQKGRYVGNDIIMILPEKTKPTAYQLKSGVIEGGTHVLNIVAPAWIRAWEIIGDTQKNISPAEWREWRSLYEEVVEDLCKQVVKKDEQALRALLLPSTPRISHPEKHAKSNPDSFDRVMTFANIRDYWDALCAIAPSLKRFKMSDVPSHLSEIKKDIREAFVREPEDDLWKEMNLV